MSMTSAFAFINCHFPFNDAVIKEFCKLPFVSDVYRTGGIYDIIIRVNSLTEKGVRENIIRNIRSMESVNSTMTMVIAEGK
jgi:DNA-binding Lrp family transcriptional regulator